MTTLFDQPKGSRTLLVVEILFMLIGFVFLGWAGYATGERLFYGSWQDYKFDQGLQGERPTIMGYLEYLRKGNIAHPEGEVPTLSLSPNLTQPKAKKLTPDEMIGRIEIPRVDVSAIIKEGVGSKTLSRAVGHVPETALPGQKGNVGIAAHRDTFFRGLRHIRQGDVIRLSTLEGTYLYQVDTMKIVWPKSVEVLDPTPDRRITLVTCYPFNYIGSAPKRFIVQGKQIGFEIASRQTSRKPGL
jgi:sortase A